MISDKLFLAWDCPDCTSIKMHISDAMFDDTIKGRDGQTLTVIHTFSNDGTRDILDVFGLDNYHAPVLLRSDEKIIAGSNDIISYLRSQGLATSDQK